MTKELENLLDAIRKWSTEDPKKRTVVCAIHDADANDGPAIILSGTNINVITTFAMIPMNDEELCDMLPAIYKFSKEKDSDNKKSEDKKPPMKGVIISNINKKKIVS